MTEYVLLLSTSRGLGGGIERYVETLEWAFTTRGVNYCRYDLHGSGSAAHARLFAQCRVRLRESGMPTRFVIAHRALLPLASLLAMERPGYGISVVCHGSDVWGTHFRPRTLVEKHLMRRPHVRVVAVSSFTAGSLFDRSPATTLPPGLAQGWFETLVKAASAVQRRDRGIQLVTTFRLADWRDKGLPQLLDAVDSLGRPDVRLTVCGSGEPSPELQRLVGEHSFCNLRGGLANDELALQLAAADLCVLATRTRFGRNACGEGFGLVLLEAQVAGTPVIAPARGGSYDAYVDGVTGIAPADESPEALRNVLEKLIQNPGQLGQMSKHAADWARQRFDPERYASLVVARLL